MLDLYSDYLISCTGERSATKMSKILGGSVSHDKVTRFLSKESYGSKELWLETKPVVREVETDTGGVLITDDTIEEKPYTDESELVTWHYDHCQGRTVKGINIVTTLVRYGKISVPVAYEVVRKDVEYCDPKTKKQKREASVSKQEHFRNMIQTSIQNDVKFEYVLADSWYASSENMQFIHNKKKKFCFPIKGNRLVSSSNNPKHFVNVQDVGLEPDSVKLVYLHGLKCPVVIAKKVFRNKDGSIGVMYLASNDTALSGPGLYEILSIANESAQSAANKSAQVFRQIFGVCLLLAEHSLASQK